MILFTVKDYIKYSKPMSFQLNEEKEDYKIKNDKNQETHQYHDKIFRTILDDKKEFIEFLKKYMPDQGFEKLEEEDVEKYNRKFVTKRMKIKEADIIYKISKRNVFVIIEQQTKVEYGMAKRMTDYCMEIINSVKTEKKYLYPLICPIVLYTGKGKWEAELTMSRMQEEFYKIPSLDYPKYNLIDINNYTKEELIQESTAMSKALLFEKMKTKLEFEEILEKLLQKGKLLKRQEIDYIKIMLRYSNFIRKELPDVADEYIEKLEKKGEDDTMMMFEKLFVEYVKDKEKKAVEVGTKKGERIGIEKGLKKGLKKGEKIGKEIGKEIGIKRGITKMIKEMIKNEISDEQIMKIAKIDKEELERLKTV